MLGKRKRARYIYRRFNKDFLFVCSAECSHSTSAEIAESIKLVNCSCCNGWSHHEHINSLVCLTPNQVRRIVYTCPLCENGHCSEFHRSRKKRIVEISLTQEDPEPADVDSKNDTISDWDGFENDDNAQDIESKSNRNEARAPVTSKKKRRRTRLEDSAEPAEDTVVIPKQKKTGKRRKSSRKRRNSSSRAEITQQPSETSSKTKKKNQKKPSKQKSQKKRTEQKEEPEPHQTTTEPKKKKKSNNPSGQRKTIRGVWIDDRQKRSQRARYKISTWIQQFQELSAECNVRIDFECVNYDSLASNQWKPYHFQTNDRVKLRSIEARRAVIQAQREKIYISMKKHKKLFVNPDEGERLQKMMNQLDGYRGIIRRALIDAFRAADKFEDEKEAEEHREVQRKKWNESFPKECLEDVLLLEEEAEVEVAVETEQADALVEELVQGGFENGTNDFEDDDNQEAE